MLLLLLVRKRQGGLCDAPLSGVKTSHWVRSWAKGLKKQGSKQSGGTPDQVVAVTGGKRAELPG